MRGSLALALGILLLSAGCAGRSDGKPSTTTGSPDAPKAGELQKFNLTEKALTTFSDVQVGKEKRIDGNNCVRFLYQKELKNVRGSATANWKPTNQVFMNLVLGVYASSSGEPVTKTKPGTGTLTIDFSIPTGFKGGVPSGDGSAFLDIGLDLDQDGATTEQRVEISYKLSYESPVALTPTLANCVEF